MKEFVLPSQIPWERLRGKDLDECAYWLLDSMGARDLNWRAGGEGGGAADQGRDLECLFYRSGPENEFERQRWWIEVKGRKGTVEPDAVKAAVNNAIGYGREVDVLVIVTNTTFSNPTRDWVKTTQANHRIPSVKLWDRTNLEKLASQHPEAVYRLFADALSVSGRLEVARSRFWNHSGYSDAPNLELFWREKVGIEWSDQLAIALVVSEVANGDISRRPWAILWEAERVLSVLAHAVLNLIFFCVRAENIGVEQRPYGSCQ